MLIANYLKVVNFLAILQSEIVGSLILQANYLTYP